MFKEDGFCLATKKILKESEILAFYHPSDSEDIQAVEEEEEQPGVKEEQQEEMDTKAETKPAAKKICTTCI